MISEQLQNRIAGLTGNSMAGMSQMGKGAISDKEMAMFLQSNEMSPEEKQAVQEFQMTQMAGFEL